VSPQEYGEGMDDAELEAAGWAAGLDVWGQVEKAYGNTSCWVVTEAAQPLVGAEYHWVLTPRDRPPDGLLGLSCTARDDFWHVVARLKALVGFDHWCMASRSWEDGAVHVVVAERSPATTVRFEFGYPPGDGH
jgi:hypothetical protein